MGKIKLSKVKALLEVTGKRKMFRKTERAIKHGEDVGEKADTLFKEFEGKVKSRMKRKRKHERKRELSQVVTGRDLKPSPRYKKKKDSPRKD